MSSSGSRSRCSITPRGGRSCCASQRCGDVGGGELRDGGNAVCEHSPTYAADAAVMVEGSARRGGRRRERAGGSSPLSSRRSSPRRDAHDGLAAGGATPSSPRGHLDSRRTTATRDRAPQAAILALLEDYRACNALPRQAPRSAQSERHGGAPSGRSGYTLAVRDHLSRRGAALWSHHGARRCFCAVAARACKLALRAN